MLERWLFYTMTITDRFLSSLLSLLLLSHPSSPSPLPPPPPAPPLLSHPSSPSPSSPSPPLPPALHHSSDSLQEEDRMYRPCLPVIPMTSGTSTNSNPGSTTDDFPSGLTSIASSDAVKQETIYNCECNSSSDSYST